MNTGSEIAAALLLGFVAASLLDRCPRRHVMIGADAAPGAVALPLAFFHDQLFVVYVPAFLLSTFGVYVNPRHRRGALGVVGRPRAPVRSTALQRLAHRTAQHEYKSAVGSALRARAVTCGGCARAASGWGCSGMGDGAPTQRREVKPDRRRLRAGT